MTQLEGTHFMAGVTAIAPDIKVEAKGYGTTNENNNIFFPPHFYLTHQINDRYWIGVGEYTRFGLATDFPSDWAGRYNSYYASIVSYSIVPSVAVKLTDKLSFAVGLEAMYFEFQQKKYTYPQGPIGSTDAHLKGDSVNYGFNLGLHYKPVEWLRLGFTYKSQVEQQLRGRIDFTDNTYYNDRDATGSITLPDSFTLGIAVYPTEKLSVEADVVYTRWSTYDALTIKYDGSISKVYPLATQASSKKDWKDVWRFQFGVEYSLNEMVDLRASYIYDQSPIPDEHVDYILPANNRHILGVGTGFKLDKWTIDLSYNYLMYEDRDVDGRASDYVYDGKFKDGNAHLVGVSVGYSF